MCCEPQGWDIYKDKPDGTCPDCGEDTKEGIAMDICGHSRVECETCGSAPCNQGC